jgi:hypothetical protein
MTLEYNKIKSNALSFSALWALGGHERSKAQNFVPEFLDIFGLDYLDADGGFEYKIKRPLDRSPLLVDFLWKQRIAIEMKSRGESLNKAYNQLKNYCLVA